MAREIKSISDRLGAMEEERTAREERMEKRVEVLETSLRDCELVSHSRRVLNVKAATCWGSTDHESPIRRSHLDDVRSRCRYPSPHPIPQQPAIEFTRTNSQYSHFDTSSEQPTPPQPRTDLLIHSAQLSPLNLVQPHRFYLPRSRSHRNTTIRRLPLGTKHCRLDFPWYSPRSNLPPPSSPHLPSKSCYTRINSRHSQAVPHLYSLRTFPPYSLSFFLFPSSSSICSCAVPEATYYRTALYGRGARIGGEEGREEEGERGKEEEEDDRAGRCWISGSEL
jgi:hypothetical protein